MTLDMFNRNETNKPAPVSDNKMHIFIMLLRGETPLSIKVSEDDRLHAKKFALPKSQIKFEVRRNNYVRVEVPNWLAVKVGLV